MGVIETFCWEEYEVFYTSRLTEGGIGAFPPSRFRTFAWNAADAQMRLVNSGAGGGGTVYLGRTERIQQL